MSIRDWFPGGAKGTLRDHFKAKASASPKAGNAAAFRRETVSPRETGGDYVSQSPREKPPQDDRT